MKTAIVYYSHTGNTAFAAEKIKELLNADIIRIEPVKAYPDKGFKMFLFGGKSAMMSETPKLAPYSFNAEDHDTVFIGMPIWASRITPPMRTFIKENKTALTNKKIRVFACCSGGIKGAEKAGADVFRLLDREFDRNDLLILIDPKDKPSEENDRRIKEFCK